MKKDFTELSLTMFTIPLKNSFCIELLANSVLHRMLKEVF